jgi:hypothetical protein
MVIAAPSATTEPIAIISLADVNLASCQVRKSCWQASSSPG